VLDGLISISERGIIESFNPACERIFGYKKEEAIGQNVKMLMPEPYHREHDGYLGRYVATNEAHIIGTAGREVSGRHKDGSVFPMDLSISQFQLKDGRHFSGIIRDITQRKRAEEAKGLLAAIVESSADAIISKNLDGIILSWNTGAEHLFGYTAEEAIGQHINLLIPSNRRQEEKHIMAQLYAGKTIENFETRRMHKDGRVIDISLTVSPIYDAAGKIIGASKVAHDISARKRSESEREKLVERLTQSNEELGRFAYIASHDLKEPLRMVTNFTGLLEKKYGNTLDEKAREYIKFAREGGERMHVLVDDLLEYARAGTQDERLEDVDCNHVLEIVKENLSMQIAESAAEVYSDNLPVIHANPVRMSMLLQNLISNSIKYQAKDMRPKIAVRCEDKEGVWQFSVKDNGIGIKNEYLTKIFEPFKRLHTKENYRGTGIGLAISLKIVENWGGKIWAASRPEKGTTIYFTIPKIIV
jgi:PAS domain S-box-containing protein